MGILDMIADPLGAIERQQNAEARQNDQWQAANAALTAAGTALEAQDHQAAIAAALTGLLALELSKT